jgi:hypothetical protein
LRKVAEIRGLVFPTLPSQLHSHSLTNKPSFKTVNQHKPSQNAPLTLQHTGTAGIDLHQPITILPELHDDRDIPKIGEGFQNAPSSKSDWAVIIHG